MYRSVWVSVFSLLAVACAAPNGPLRTEETNLPKVETVKIERGWDSWAVPGKIGTVFTRALETELYHDGPFRKGRGLIMRVQFVRFIPGQRGDLSVILPGTEMPGGLSVLAGSDQIVVRVAFFSEQRRYLGDMYLRGETGKRSRGKTLEDIAELIARRAANYTTRLFAKEPDIGLKRPRAA